MKPLSSSIKELRVEYDMTQADMAKVLGVGRTTYVGYENGTIVPPYDKIVKIADHFGVSIDYLTGKSDFKTMKEAVSTWKHFDEMYDPLNTRDKNDIAKNMNEILHRLLHEQSALTFNGEVMDEQTKELLIAALENSLTIGKIRSKQKYTPNRYKH